MSSDNRTSRLDRDSLGHLETLFYRSDTSLPPANDEFKSRVQPERVDDVRDAVGSAVIEKAVPTPM